MPERTAFCLLIFLTKFRTIVPIRFLEQLKEKIIFFVDAPFFFFCLSIKTFRTKLRRRRRRCRICQRFKDVLTIKHYGPPWWFSDVKGNYLDNLANVLWCKFDDSKIIWQRFLDVERRFSERRLWRCFATLFFWLSHSRRLSTAPRPTRRARRQYTSCTLLYDHTLYSHFWYNDSCEVWSYSYLPIKQMFVLHHFLLSYKHNSLLHIQFQV